jgi:hypothetical protein
MSWKGAEGMLLYTWERATTWRYRRRRSCGGQSGWVAVLTTISFDLITISLNLATISLDLATVSLDLAPSPLT